MSRRRKRRERGRRASTIWFAIAAFAIIGLAVLLAVLPLRRQVAATAPRPGWQEVAVGMSGFSPSRLQAGAGEEVGLTFVNPDSSFHTDGGGWHQFRIEALDIDVRIPPSTTKSVNLGTLPAGTYEFYCDVCCGGKENPTMRGTLEVGA